MTQTCEAVYEDGVFRPVSPVAPSLNEGQHVRLIVETDAPDSILQMAAEVYQGLSEEQVNEIEQIAFDRSGFWTRPSR